MEDKSNNSQVTGVAYESVPDNYLEKRQLKKGAAGWLLLTCLGVSYVISGDFAGWNFGLEQGGFGGLLIATLLMALMYTTMVFGLAELTAAIPTVGGGYGFARRAMGPLGGFLTGSAILVEYAIAPAAIVIFISGYVSELVGLSGPLVYISFYVVFIGIHLWGAGEALKIMLVITGIAVLALLVFIAGMIPHFDSANLFDIAINENAAGASAFFPEGWLGVWAAIPFAIWFFLAVEGVPLAAEESKEPAKDIPRGIVYSMLILLAFAALVLFLAPGASSADLMKDHPAPLVGALQHVYGDTAFIAAVVNVLGLAGLIASFFSIIFAYSRQVFALSRAGYFPRWLSLTNTRKTPTYALVIPGLIGLLLSFSNEGDLMINMAVFGATISYILMMLSHIILRVKEPDLTRPYRTPGGIVTTGVALSLAVIALISTFLVDSTAALFAGVVYLTMVCYFVFYSRHHLVSKAPEEEFEAIKNAEKELQE